MAKKLAVIVPGILGSELYYPRDPQPLELWGDNMVVNYRRLCEQPNSLHWAGIPAASRLIAAVRTSESISWFKRTIYETLIAYARGLPGVADVVECSYD